MILTKGKTLHPTEGRQNKISKKGMENSLTSKQAICHFLLYSWQRSFTFLFSFFILYFVMGLLSGSCQSSVAQGCKSHFVSKLPEVIQF